MTDIKEINRRCAEGMGWKVDSLENQKIHVEKIRIKHGDLYADWNPCESISDAWMLLTYYHEKTGEWILVSPCGDKWVAYEKTGCADHDFGFCEYAETAPLAISLAFLEVINGRE